MDAFKIYYNFAVAKRQANELDNISRKLKYTAENYISGKGKSLDGVWDGDASEEFFKKESRIVEKMIEESKSLHKTAETIRRIAKRTYDAEMKALDISKQRSYS